jgi:methyl-accepting chemotaxis protein
MPRQSVENSLERLEQRVTAIEQLPARMDRLESQIVQLRAEMRDEFSAIRRELTERIEDARAESRSLFEDARRENRVLFEEALARITNIQEGLSATRHTKKR